MKKALVIISFFLLSFNANAGKFTEMLFRLTELKKQQLEAENIVRETKKEIEKIEEQGRERALWKQYYICHDIEKHCPYDGGEVTACWDREKFDHKQKQWFANMLVEWKQWKTDGKILKKTNQICTEIRNKNSDKLQYLTLSSMSLKDVSPETHMCNEWQAMAQNKITPTDEQRKEMAFMLRKWKKESHKV